MGYKWFFNHLISHHKLKMGRDPLQGYHFISHYKFKMGRDPPQGPKGASKVVPQPQQPQQPQQQLGPLYDLPATPQVKREEGKLSFFPTTPSLSSPSFFWLREKKKRMDEEGGKLRKWKAYLFFPGTFLLLLGSVCHCRECVQRCSEKRGGRAMTTFPHTFHPHKKRES